jgi:hypothetical protein
MLTDYQIAMACCDIYNGPLSRQWDIYDLGTTDGICWGAFRVDGITYIILRGSVTAQDWLRDATAIANPFTHDALGACHPGFYIGMHELWAEIKTKTQGPWVIAGHSLGAGRACILSGVMIVDGHVPLKRTCFGEPLPAFSKLAKVLSAIPEQNSYRNGDAVHHDPVTDVPLSIPPEEYVHPVPLKLVTAMPTDNSMGVFSWHHCPLYAEALSKLA